MNTINSYTTLEFDKIRNTLADFCINESAKEKAQTLEPTLSELTLKKLALDTDNARKIIDVCGTPPIPSTKAAADLIQKIEKDGLLYPDELNRFLSFISACKRLCRYFIKAQTTQTSLSYIGDGISALDEIYEEINRCIGGDSVNTDASKELAQIRKNISVCEKQLKAKLDEILKSKKKYCSESFVSMKNNRYTVPVKKEYKNQIAGSVIAASQTGTTLFIEPSTIIKFTDKLESLKIEESIETDRILYSIAALIDDYKSDIKNNIETVEAVDFIFAKGKLSAEQNAVGAKINTERFIKIKKGRHPLINKDVCKPIDFEIGNGTIGVVITGPNTGGKTAALKMVGLFCIMAQCGLHVPCENADICMNGAVLCDIGDGQNISENLSTFSAHIKNVVSILKSVTKESLVLLDELGSGTDPTEGTEIAIAILEQLRNTGCLFVATTHYDKVKSYASTMPELQNAKMTFNKETLKPDYKLIIGEAGESCAFYIAEKLGFPQNLLEFAKLQGGEKTGEKFAKETLSVTGENKFCNENSVNSGNKIIKNKPQKKSVEHAESFNIGDSVTVYPEKKIGIVFKTADDNGNIGVQISGKKRLVNHKRLKLKVSASEMYPPDYDFSIVFDSVANRKASKKMSKRHCPDLIITHDDDFGNENSKK